MFVLDDRTTQKNKIYVQNTKRIHKSLISLKKSLAPYRDDMYSKPYINVLKDNLYNGNKLTKRTIKCFLFKFTV